jgi:tetratricopeptide (TPR) repeat protein
MNNMIYSIQSQKKSLAFLLFFLFSSIFSVQAQNNDHTQIKAVFDQLVAAYGSAKPAPQLIILNDKPKQITPAKYYSYPKPNIKIDAYLLTICRTFDKDSLNALSIVLSHELAHYYSDHTFCSDYAYAIKDKNKSLVPALKNANLNEKISKETEADNKGFFYAAAAGFSPFNLQVALIDKIYKEYVLPDIQLGYPTKEQRKNIAKTAETKSQELYGYFKTGLKAMEEKKYDEAIEAFGKANSYIPYRENYNNIGVAKTLKALDLIKPNDIEKENPNRFKYPIEIDNTSRLNKDITRGLDDNSEEMTTLLKSAQKDFEKAISLDPDYTIGYINLACVFDLLGNYPKSIGTILELSKERRNTIEAKRILAIAYFHYDKKTEANLIWDELKI